MIQHRSAIEYRIRDIDRRYVGNSCTYGHVTHHPVVRLDSRGRPMITPACGQGALMAETAMRPTRRPTACTKCLSWVKRHNPAMRADSAPIAGIDALLTQAALG